MSQFTYRLQPLLEQKEELRKQADQEVARQEEELQKQLSVLQALQGRVQELIEKRTGLRRDLMGRPEQQSPLTAAEVRERSEFAKALGLDIQEAENKVSSQRLVIVACEARLNEAKQHAAEARREVEVLTKHREKQEERFHRELQAKEEVALDEIGNVLYATRRRST